MFYYQQYPPSEYDNPKIDQLPSNIPATLWLVKTSRLLIFILLFQWTLYRSQKKPHIAHRITRKAMSDIRLLRNCTLQRERETFSCMQDFCETTS